MKMDPIEKMQIGKTDLYVTRLGLGGLSLGYVPEDQATATIQKTFELGINFIDTAPLYGLGKSELDIGHVVAGRKRESFVISTKVGRLLRSTSQRGWEFDFSHNGLQLSLESSLSRLGLDRVDILFIHDPDDYYYQALTETFPALAELRSQGIVKAIGVGMNRWQMELRFAKEADPDCFLLAGGRYTLLEQDPLTEFLPFCLKKGISVIVGTPFGGREGILASNLQEGAKHNHREPNPEILTKAIQIKMACDRHRVPLKAAALQFVLAHPAVSAVIPGSGSPSHIEENFRMVQYPIPQALWKELRDKGLIPVEAPTPN